MKRLLTSKETAFLLRVSERTLRRWRSELKDPCWIESEGIIRYKESDVSDYLQYGRVNPQMFKAKRRMARIHASLIDIQMDKKSNRIKGAIKMIEYLIEKVMKYE